MLLDDGADVGADGGALLWPSLDGTDVWSPGTKRAVKRLVDVPRGSRRGGARERLRRLGVERALAGEAVGRQPELRA